MRAHQLKRRKGTSTRHGISLPHRSHSSNSRVIAIALFLFMIVWVAFGRTLGHEFVNYDDGDYVYENPNVTQGLSLRGVVWAFTHVHAANWHPLTTLSHMLDCQLYGLQPWGHHLTNVLLQAAAAILLFLALRRVTGNLWPSAFVAAVFAIHPLRVESVGRADEAVEQLRESLQIDESYPEAHYNLGCVLARLGQRGEVVAQLSEALRLKPDYPEAEEQLRELGAAPLP